MQDAVEPSDRCTVALCYFVLCTLGRGGALLRRLGAGDAHLDHIERFGAVDVARSG